MSFDKFVKMYFDWFNNFITIGAFAEHYGITEEEAGIIVEIGEAISNLNINIGHTNR